MSNSTSPTTTDSTEDLNLYFYHPSTPAAAIFAVLYALLTLWHGYINFLATRKVAQKHKYTIPLFVACLISTAGWSIRMVSIHNLSSIPLYAVSASYIVISPIFVCAALYLLLTRSIRTTLPEHDRRQVFLGVRPRWIGRIFITSDIFSFLTQCSGSGIASSGNWKGDLKTVGTNVLLFGLSLQLATFSIFLLVLWMFEGRVRGGKDVEMGTRVVMRGVWAAGSFVQVYMPSLLFRLYARLLLGLSLTNHSCFRYALFTESSSSPWESMDICSSMSGVCTSSKLHQCSLP